MPNYKWAIQITLTKGFVTAFLAEELFHTLEDAQKNLLAVAMEWGVKNPSVTYELVARSALGITFYHDKGLVSIHTNYRG